MKKNRIIFYFLLANLLSASCSKPNLSETAALDIIQKQPDVQIFLNNQCKSNSCKPIIRQENLDTKNSLFEFYIGESHSDRNVLWNRFAVDKKTRQIFIYDIESTEYIPIEKWRESQNEPINE